MDNKTYWQFMDLCMLVYSPTDGKWHDARGHITKRTKEIDAEWKALEAKVGHKVTANEIESEYPRRNPLIRD